VEIPHFKIDEKILVALAIGAAVLALILARENSRLRRDLNQITESNIVVKKPCNCHEKEVNNYGNVSDASGPTTTNS
jgi:hypothetical protein